MALFSIVTVTLNPPAEDLRKTVESVLAQRIEDWELLVKDGGSTRCIDEELPDDSRIRFVNQADTGIFDAMNQALAQVQGDYVCFLNAGDLFYDGEALAAVAAAAALEPEVDFFYGDVAKPRSRSGFEIYPEQLTRFFLFGHSICHQSWFVSKRYYNRDRRYETGMLSGADPRFLLRMILVDRVRLQKIKRVLISYQGGGVSQRLEVSIEAKKWFDKLRRSVYSKREYYSYMVIYNTRDVLKKIFYDRVVWRILKWLRNLSHDI